SASRPSPPPWSFPSTRHHGPGGTQRAATTETRDGPRPGSGSLHHTSLFASGCLVSSGCLACGLPPLQRLPVGRNRSWPRRRRSGYARLYFVSCTPFFISQAAHCGAEKCPASPASHLSPGPVTNAWRLLGSAGG